MAMEGTTMSFLQDSTHAVSSVMPIPQMFTEVSSHAKEQARPDNKESAKEKKVSEKDVQNIVNDINSTLQTLHTELSFSVDKETSKMVLKVINTKTHEVIRQIPAEDALRLSSRISKLLGTLVDQNA